jgi:hypothetical protein
MRSWIVPLLLALFLPFIGDRGAAHVRSQDKAAQTKPSAEKVARGRADTNLQEIALAFHAYLGEHKEYPPAAMVGRDGKSLLSWRVLLLPYLSQEKLFREFNLAEPWDSVHNKKLLAKMPILFAPTWGERAEPTTTPWQVFTGPETMFVGTKGCRISDIGDGTSNTAMVVEANRLVPWTKPEDLIYGKKKDLPKLGYMFPGEFLFATADAARHVGKRDFDVPMMRFIIMPNDGNIIDFNKILAKPQR